MLKITIYCLFALSGILFAGNEFHTPVTQAPDTLRIDGVLNEPEWQSVPENGTFTKFGKNTPEAETTSFKVLNTPRGVVFAITMKDSEIKGLKRNQDEPVWHDDCIEIFIAPVEKFSNDPNVREFYHFIVNAENSRYDAVFRGGIADPTRNFRWMSATRRTSNGWTAEIMLPFYNFAVAEKGIPAIWQCNIIRENKTSAGNMLSAWSPTSTANASESFGKLTGIAADEEFFRVELGKTELVRAGDAVRLDFEAGAGKGRILDACAVIRRKGKILAVRRAPIRCDNTGRASGSILFPKFEPGMCELEMLLIDPDGQTALFEARSLRADFSPVTLQILRPLYRNTIYASNEQHEIELKFAFRGEKTSPQDINWEITVTNSAGRELYRAETHEGSTRIPVGTDWPFGKLLCRVKASAGGEAEAVVQRVPPAHGRKVLINAAGVLTVDDQPFFPRGFMGVINSTDLTTLAAAGCNTVHSYSLHHAEFSEVRNRLDQCEKAGLKMLLYPFAGSSFGFWGVKHNQKTLPYFSENQLNKMREFVKSLQDHPALLGWYLFDEPRGAAWCDELKRCYTILRETDPYHPVFGCDNSLSSSIALLDHCDVMLLDIYLNPFAGGEPARSVSTVTTACRKLAEAIQGTGKSFWYVPQAFDADSFEKPNAQRERRAPTFEESLASVWGALASGARGILAYKIGDPSVVKPDTRHSNAGVYASEALRAAFFDSIMPDLAIHEEFLLNKTAVPGITPLLAAKGQKQQQPAILVVNPTTEKQRYRQTIPMTPYEIRFFTEDITQDGNR